MKVPGHFDSSIGIETISQIEPLKNILPEGSPVVSKEALPLALVNNFLTYQLKNFLMNSLAPEYLSQEGLLKDRIQRLLKLFAEEQKERELCLFLEEDLFRHEKLMEERQKQIGS